MNNTDHISYVPVSMASDSNNNRWAVRQAAGASILVSGLPNIDEDTIIKELLIQEGIQVEKIVPVGDDRVLIHYHSDDQGECCTDVMAATV